MAARPPRHGIDAERVAARRALGAAGEDLAAAWYVERGYEVLDRNWRCREGELDLVVRRGSTVVFCEVKCRTGRNYGDPLESITYAKVRRLRQLAAEWLNQHRDLSVDGMRLDAIGVLLQRDQQPVLVHVSGIGDQ